MNTYPFQPYKIDTHFNKSANYGPHEGCDFNGLGGGNTDCGFDLKAIKDGEVVHVSKSTKDYGYLLCFKVIADGRDYYVRYAHCSEVLVQSGDTIREGQIVAKMGSTGNSKFCHLHLDVLDKKPDDWRFYTKMVTDWFVDPIWFIENIDGRITNEDTDPEKKYVIGLGDKTFDELVVEYGLERQRKIDKEKELKELEYDYRDLQTKYEQCQDYLSNSLDDISVFLNLLSTELMIEAKDLSQAFNQIQALDAENKRLSAKLDHPIIKAIDLILTIKQGK